MTTTYVMSRRGAGALGAMLWLGAPAASAQEAPTRTGEQLPDGGSTRDLTVPGAGGVADTGLGGSTNGTGAERKGTGAQGAPGTGMSVKGPAGQGMDGKGISNGIGSSGTVGPGQ